MHTNTIDMLNNKLVKATARFRKVFGMQYKEMQNGKYDRTITRNV